LVAWRAKREKLDPELLYDLSLWIFVGGLLGARLLYVWEYWGVVQDGKVQIGSLLDIFKIWKGGIVFYGSVMGGVLAFLLYWSLRRFPLRATLDAIAPALALGIAIGRLGCFLNGCCYGDRCDLPSAVSFPGQRVGVPGNRERIVEPSPPWADQWRHRLIPDKATWSLPVHPTQIYSSIDGLILFALLWAYYPLRRRDGEVMALLMVTYPVTR